MKNIYLKIYHPKIKVISDRTFRGILSRVSNVLRGLQNREVEYLIDSSSLSTSEKQSFKDKISKKLEILPCYYVEEVKRGSIEIVLSFTGIAIWFLSLMAAELLKESFKKTDLYKNIVNLLSSEQREERILIEIKSTLGEKLSLNRFKIQGTSTDVDENGDIVLSIVLETPKEIEKGILEIDKKIDYDYVIEKCIKKIGELEAEEKNEK